MKRHTFHIHIRQSVEYEKKINEFFAFIHNTRFVRTYSAYTHTHTQCVCIWDMNENVYSTPIKHYYKHTHTSIRITSFVCIWCWQAWRTYARVYSSNKNESTPNFPRKSGTFHRKILQKWKIYHKWSFFSHIFRGGLQILLKNHPRLTKFFSSSVAITLFFDTSLFFQMGEFFFGVFHKN